MNFYCRERVETRQIETAAPESQPPGSSLREPSLLKGVRKLNISLSFP